MSRSDSSSNGAINRLPSGPNGEAAARPPTDLLDQINAAIFSTDLDGRVTRWNRGAEALTGYPAAEVLGRPAPPLGDELARPRPGEVMDRLRERGTYEVEFLLPKRSGDTVPVHLSLTLLRGPDGVPAGVAGLAVDISERRQAEEGLRRSEERFSLAAQAVDAVIYDLDLRTREVYRSPGLVEVIGYHPEEVPTSADWWESRIHPDDLPGVLIRAEAALAEDRPFDLEYRALHRRGHYVHIWDRALVVRDRQGRAARLVGWWVNVTQRRRAEEQLRESEERHRLLAELGSDYTFTCRVDVNGPIHIDSASEGFRRVTGYTVDEVEARGGWSALVHPADLPDAEQMKPLLAGQRHTQELRIVTKAGKVRWIYSIIHPIWDKARRRVVRLLGAVQDITERKVAERRLHDSAQRLQALSRRLLEVQESERRHLARELHDEVAQTLTALSFNLGSSARLEGAALRSALDEAQALVKELTGQVRDLSLRLRPTMLDDLGLLPALLWLFGRYAGQTRLRVDFRHSGLGRRFRHEVETTAYRIVQEALTNVARHAGVEAATVRLWIDRDRLCAQVEDRGAGFDPAAAPGDGTTGGLSGMHERARLLGGRLVVESVRGAGTCVTAELPLGPDEEKPEKPSDADDAAAGR